MCGIFGLWHSDGTPLDVSLLQQATTTLRHRGPDDEGYLLADTAAGTGQAFRGPDSSLAHDLPIIPGQSRSFNLAFGFRRLSILDLSPSGHQPMSSPDGRLWIVFNGEIYNYVELRQELQALGHTFRTGTDTEVILAAYAAWGEGCLSHFNGMWAFAIWDTARRTLFCARDRFGIKPFYYRWDGKTLAFASEIKALLALPETPHRPNEAAIYNYLDAGRLDYSSQTFFEGIQQLPPAHSLTLSNAHLQSNCFWRLDPGAAFQSTTRPDEAYIQEFGQLFEDSVRIHLRSDVPVGTCLSGGLDSSSIVALANRLLFANQTLPPGLVGPRQKTFSACFEDTRFDERKFIEPVLQATGAEANFTFPTAEKLRQDLPRLLWHQDEPFGSTSIFAQWCVMEKAAERGVKVLLDGQGGDEILAGYHTYFDYFWASLLQQRRLGDLQREQAAYRRSFGGSAWQMGLRTVRPFLPRTLRTFGRRFNARSAPGGLAGMNPEFVHAHWNDLHQAEKPSGDPLYDYLYDTLTHSSLPHLLHYEDRNAMAFSIEARVPYLDYRLVEFAYALPDHLKIRNAITKFTLREAMRGKLPEAVRTRKDKMGFVTPEQTWLNQEFKEWLREIFSSTSFRQRGYFDSPQIFRALDEHASGKRNLKFLAWRWANLELWLRQMIDKRP